jgi:methanogenic corrinoid protein MtbC1
MRQQPITDDSFSDADALRLLRGMAPRNENGRGHRSRHLGNAGDLQSRRAVLTRTVEDEVIPRLLTRRQRPQRAFAPVGADTAADHVTTLVKLVLAGTQAQADGFVESLHQGGAAQDYLLLDVLSNAARRLGAMWEEDLCDFSDVTIGVLRLANVMRLINQAFDEGYQPSAAGPSALLVQMPGEQHGLGLAMVVNFFRRSGWNVCHVPVIDSQELISRVQRDWFNVVGISMACSNRLEKLAANIRSIRIASRNPAVGVMVGGPPFIEHPQLAAMVGADMTASDGLQAALHAKTLVSRLARER